MPTPMERYRKGAERALQELQMRQGLQQQEWGRGMAEKRLGLEEEQLAETKRYHDIQTQPKAFEPSSELEWYLHYNPGKKPADYWREKAKIQSEFKEPGDTDPYGKLPWWTRGLTPEQVKSYQEKQVEGAEDDYRKDPVFKMMYEGIATAKMADKKRATRGPLTPQEIQATMQEAIRQYRELQGSLPNPELDELFK